MITRGKQLMWSLSDKRGEQEEPALKVGLTSASVAGIIAIIVVLFPNLEEKYLNLIFVLFTVVLPVVVAFLTRRKVWSPASVQEVVNEAEDRIKESTKALAEKNRLRLKPKPDEMLPDDVAKFKEELKSKNFNTLSTAYIVEKPPVNE